MIVIIIIIVVVVNHRAMLECTVVYCVISVINIMEPYLIIRHTATTGTNTMQGVRQTYANAMHTQPNERTAQHNTCTGKNDKIIYHDTQEAQRSHHSKS